MPGFVILNFFQINHKIKNKVQRKKKVPTKTESLVIFHISGNN